MVNVSARIDNPQQANIAITISMPIDDWDRIQQALSEAKINGTAYPMWKVSSSIAKVLNTIRGVVRDSIEVPD